MNKGDAKTEKLTMTWALNAGGLNDNPSSYGAEIPVNSRAMPVPLENAGGTGKLTLGVYG
jgi:hypothetical protein